jgi:hypothetical protein
MNLGSGNANFYYASTLVWAIANGLVCQIFDLDAKEIDKATEFIFQI